MNSLDFINKQIEKIIFKLIEKVEEREKFVGQCAWATVDFLNAEIKYLENERDTLYQIKSELEIMELIENGWSSIEQTLSGEKIIKFEKLNLDDWLKVWKTLEEIGLKKALEVGNNHE